MCLPYKTILANKMRMGYVLNCLALDKGTFITVFTAFILYKLALIKSAEYGQNGWMTGSVSGLDFWSQGCVIYCPIVPMASNCGHELFEFRNTRNTIIVHGVYG